MGFSLRAVHSYTGKEESWRCIYAIRNETASDTERRPGELNAAVYTQHIGHADRSRSQNYKVYSV